MDYRTDRRAWPFLFLVLAVVFAAGCGDDNDNGTNPIPDGAAIRVIQASPDAPAVDIYAAGAVNPLFTTVEYGDVTPYQEVAADTVKIELKPAGADPSSPAFVTTIVAIGAGDKVTAVVAGLLGSTSPEQTLRVLPLVEGFTDPSSNAGVRIVHAGADAPVIAIDVLNDGTPEITDFARFAATDPAGLELPAGAPLALGIRAGNPLERVTAFTTPALPAGGELFIVVTGLLGRLPREKEGFSLLVAAPSGALGFVQQDPVLFALHASPDAPAVDIGLAGTAGSLVSDLSFAEISAPVQVQPGGAYALEFRPAGTTMVAATATTPILAAGERYLAVATGFLAPDAGEEAFQLVSMADAFDLELETPILRLAHESPDAPAVDIGTVSDDSFTPLAPFSNLSFPESSVEAGTSVPAAILTLGVAPTGTITPVATFTLTTQSGMRAMALTAGALTPGSGDQPLGLLIVQTAVWPWTAIPVPPN